MKKLKYHSLILAAVLAGCRTETTVPVKEKPEILMYIRGQLYLSKEDNSCEPIAVPDNSRVMNPFMDDDNYYFIHSTQIGTRQGTRQIVRLPKRPNARRLDARRLEDYFITGEDCSFFNASIRKRDGTIVGYAGFADTLEQAAEGLFPNQGICILRQGENKPKPVSGIEGCLAVLSDDDKIYAVSHNRRTIMMKNVNDPNPATVFAEGNDISEMIAVEGWLYTIENIEGHKVFAYKRATGERRKVPVREGSKNCLQAIREGIAFLIKGSDGIETILFPYYEEDSK